MLKELTIENYRSFDKPQVFSMEACPENQVSEFDDHIVSINQNRLLKISSIYGPNGGGKSNLLKAITLPLSIVRQNGDGLPFRAFFDAEHFEKAAQYETFIYSKNKICKGTVFFVNNDFEIGYHFEISFTPFREDRFEGESEIIQIHQESVSFRKANEKDFTLLFERGDSGIVKSAFFQNVDLIKNTIPLSPYVSFVRYISVTYRGDEKTMVRPEFGVMSSLYSEINSLRTFSSELHYILPENLVRTALAQKKTQIIKALNAAGIAVKDLITKNVGGQKRILFVRTGEDGNDYSLPSTFESNGTKKLLAFLITLVSIPKNVVLLADDFDSQLHPKLIQAIMSIFTDPQSQRQLIFNSHDLLNMTNENFRRDEIWFACRGDDYATTLFPLSSIIDYQGKPVRKDAKYYKQYLEDRYGADPFIKKGLSLL